MIDTHSKVNFASFFLPGSQSYSGDLLYVLSHDGTSGDILLSKSTLFDMQTDVTTTFVLLSQQNYANPGGRLAVSESGQVFACIFDIDDFQDPISTMQLVLMGTPTSTNEATIKVVEN